MKTLARTLLVWFVLLALPFQGYAAAAMACAHGVGQVSAAATHQGSAASPPCHASAQKQSPSQDEGAQSGDKTCSSCAACSVGAAITPAGIATAAEGCPRGPCPACVPTRIGAVDPDLPERPPRLNLA